MVVTMDKFYSKQLKTFIFDIFLKTGRFILATAICIINLKRGILKDYQYMQLPGSTYYKINAKELYHSIFVTAIMNLSIKLLLGITCVGAVTLWISIDN